MGWVGARFCSAMSCAARGVRSLEEPGGPGGARLSSLVGQQRALRRLLPVAAGLELGQVAVVIALHLEVEDLVRCGRSA